MKSEIDRLYDRLATKFPDKSFHIAYKTLCVPCMEERSRGYYWEIYIDDVISMKFDSFRTLEMYVEGILTDDIATRFKALVSEELL